nr:MAG TPA: hypothetical protein [Caudoviricetes sp.]DAO01437.1 MAG TPA: hypothetical protein [Caudoviricetes sp.]DAX31439.1 MAG TPA: hypothetical protein [Caudoviricetes sp.]
MFRFFLTSTKHFCYTYFTKYKRSVSLWLSAKEYIFSD